MSILTATASRGLRRISPAVFGAACVTSLTAPARAHFILQAPPSWMSQDASGLPEKLGPCGNEGGGTATGTVTAFQPGQMITVTVDEVVYHPGHYRFALSVNSRSELPAEPTVTATSSTPCGSVPIQSSPVVPVLADGVFQHTSPFTMPQSIQVTLPSNVTCTKCTLQVIEFMSDHPLNNPGGCFYHHCADISIQAAGGGAGTGGAGAAGGNIGAGGNQGVGGVNATGGVQGLGASHAGGMPALGGNTGLTASGGALASGGLTNINAGTSASDNAGSCSCTVPIGSSRSPWGALSIGALWALTRLRSRRNRSGN